MINIRQSLWVVFGLILFAGCGYSTGSLLPSKYRTIYIEPFKNKVAYTQSRSISYVPLLEVKVKDAIASRFLFDGHLRIGGQETADLILRGELVGLERQELRITDNQDVQEFRINIIVNLSLWDPVDQKEVWSEPSFAGEASYFVSGPLAKSESAAVEEALNDLARRAVERTLEDW
ncbi:MAG: hypothetical protein JNN05_09885 [Candidatus Omnitrophica bacterium]|nr:hypothetical protein [Candidatus Omnitrophota bacterium]